MVLDGSIFIFKDLFHTEYVFVRNDTVKQLLQHPYDGPFKVLSRGPKTFILYIRGKEVTVTINRLKPAYMLADGDEQRSPSEDGETSHVPEAPVSSPAEPRITRSGRRVHFPDRYQA